ncbi:MAG: hypothetical protein FJ276_01415, partial [Planctomycetes bacterium]|nr:hypothetical protein [Planctomycetota bacterium]
MSDNRTVTSHQWLLVFLAAVGCVVLVLPGTVSAEFTPIKHSDFQAVDDNGMTAWGTSGYHPVEMVGVIINNPWDMLNYETGFRQWQVYFQALSGTGDFGGTAMYTNQAVVTPGDWSRVMQSLNYPKVFAGDPVTDPLRYGDVVRVQATRPGMFFRGKMNINSGHQQYDPPQNMYDKFPFTIEILGRDLTPSVADITLAHLKDINNDFIFDETRLTGCEHYQASLVHLTSLTLASGTWGLNQDVIVRQGELTMPMRLGLDPGLISDDILARVTSGSPFNLTAILDQEDTS